MDTGMTKAALMLIYVPIANTNASPVIGAMILTTTNAPGTSKNDNMTPMHPWRNNAYPGPKIHGNDDECMGTTHPDLTALGILKGIKRGAKRDVINGDISTVDIVCAFQRP